jgi:16S rRNA (guanine527-N7)-methyltransferase
VTPESQELEALLERAGVEPALRGRLARYGALVLQTNRRFNLTGARTGEEIGSHLIDSLTVVPYVSDPYVDIGTGGGFPAVPVALATGMPITMIEANLKKARFLETTLKQLDLRGEVVAERAEMAGHRPELRERFASGTGRAIGSAPTVVELLLPFLRTGGVAVLQRGHLGSAERVALEDAALVLGGRVEIETSAGDERRIIVLRKEAVTPSRFPRRTGIPAKRPLCSP